MLEGTTLPWKLRIIGLLPIQYRRPMAFLAGIFWVQKLKLSVFIAFNVIAAVFEGASLGAIGLAVASLTGAVTDSDSSTFGKILAWLDSLISDSHPAYLFMVLLAAAATMQLLRSSAQFISSLVLIKLRSAATRNLYSRLTTQLTSLSYLEVSSKPGGYITLLVGEARKAIALLTQIATLIISMTFLCGYMVTLAIGAPSLGVWLLVLLVLVFLAMNKVSRKILALSRKRIGVSREGSERTFEYLNAPKFLRTFDTTDTAKEIMDRYRNQEIKYIERAECISSVIRPIFDFLAMVLATTVLVVAYSVSSENPAEMVGSVSILVLVMVRMIPRFLEINNGRLQIANTLPLLEMLTDFLQEKRKSYIQYSGEPWQGLHRDLVFDRVTVSYGGHQKPVLRDVSLRIPAHRTTGIVGPSGSGKSTLIDSLLCLIPIQSGKILVDGVDVAGIRLSDWLARIGYVEQDANLFNMTVADNIRMGKPEASDSEIFEAAEKADIHELISSFPDGYDTMVGSRGYRLSGGQKQRVALARALVRKSEILILDEATSALDSESETRIRNAIDRLRNKHTIIVIAHRLSTLRSVDQIVVLEDGRISEVGAPDELLKREGYFQRVWSEIADR